MYFQTIECYLRAILNVKGASDKLYQLSHYTTGVILNGTREQLAQQRLKKVVSETSYFSEYLGHTHNIVCLNVIQVNFEQYDGVIAAVNVNNVH